MPVMFRTLLISVCLICSATSADTPVANEDYKLLASDGSSNDYFGNSVSISGDGTTVIVGAPYDDDNGTDSGAAYIYELVKGVWQETKLLASDGSDGDWFGYSVSISSDGSTAIVGAPYDDDNGSSSGSAYIYELVKGVWQETKLLASNGAGYDQFGNSVSISSDSTTAIVGAFRDDNDSDASDYDYGSAYIYKSVKGIWQETKLLASDGGTYDEFGVSVSISSDGSTALVGASGDDDNGSDSGSAYIYELVGGVWEETKLTASDGTSSDFFGHSVSISSDGSTAIVGAYDDDGGSAYIYRFNGSSWSETKLIASDVASNDDFGKSVSISSDGTTAIVGANYDDDNGSYSGSAYIYRLVKGVWQEIKLLASDGSSDDNFGDSVSISSDGTTAIVGAYLDDDNGSASGSAYIFTREDEDGDGVYDDIDNCYLYNPDQLDCNGNGIGDVCDIADGTSYNCDGKDGNTVPDECQPDCDGDGWIDACDSEGDCNNDDIPDNCEVDCNENGFPDDCDIDFGISEDCNENGVPDECDIAEGAEEDCNENDVPDSCDLADDPSLDCDGDGVFDSCAINDGLVEDCNGNNIPDSCEIDDGTALDCNGNGVPDSCDLHEKAKLLASDGASGDYFGHSVSISSNGTTAIVGAYGNDDNGSYSGSAYIYELVKGVWQETTLTASDGSNDDYFGHSVSISSNGTTAIVGAYGNDDNGSYSGSAYIYKLVSGVWQETKLLASDWEEFDRFGESVSISGDGTTALVAAPRDDDNGSQSGSAYIYELVGGVWEETKLLASDGASSDYFGTSVSISSDGSTAIVGADGGDDNGSNSGSAYIYELVKGVWQETKLLASDGASGDYFGESVSISSDGTTAIVGTPYDDDNDNGSGSAYIYELIGGVWQETKLLASDGADADYFGYSVSLSSDGSTAIVGAHGGDDNGTDSGSAYIFRFDGSDWNEEDKLIASNAASGAEFGFSVSISGNYAIVGARYAVAGSDSGSAYIYPFYGEAEDCNANDIPDECDIDDGTSTDWNGNGIPDECEVDCNGNGVPDPWDIKTGTSEDCNANGVPDECDIEDGTSSDVNSNGIPDECELDCNANGYPDDYDIQIGWSFDVNGDGIPDECQCIADITGNSGTPDGMVDVLDLLAIIGYWGSSIPAGDVNNDGIVNVVDLLIVLSNWGPCE